MPPTKAFWSITAYNARNFLIANPIDRYAIRGTDPLVFNPDGSLTLYLQAQPPANGPESNWLPIPDSGAFSLTARIYWPKKAVLDGSWHMPPIKRVK